MQYNHFECMELFIERIHVEREKNKRKCQRKHIEKKYERKEKRSNEKGRVSLHKYYLLSMFKNQKVVEGVFNDCLKSSLSIAYDFDGI